MKLNAKTYAGHVQKGKAVNKTSNDVLVTELYAGNPPETKLVGRITFEYNQLKGTYTLIYYPVINHIPKGRIILEENIQM